MSTHFFTMDERAGDISRRVCTVMYGITILLLIAVIFYREFVLNQKLEELRDIANILTFNVILTPCAIEFLGGFSVRKVKPLAVIVIYVGFILIGLAFTIFKDTILLDQQLSTNNIMNSLLIVSTICAAIVAVYVFFAYFGMKRIDRKID